MGISRDSRHKRSATGAKRATYRKKRAFEKGRQPSNTRIGTKRIHLVRTRGGNRKFRGLRLEAGNFSWGSEGISRKTRVIVVAYHPSNNELVRTNTLTKSAVVQIDAAPFRQWYEAHYGQPIGRRRQQKSDVPEEKKSNSVTKKQAARFADSGKVESAIERQFEAGRLYAVIASRPGQSGRVDGYILEGEELAFYQRAIRKKNNRKIPPSTFSKGQSPKMPPDKTIKTRLCLISDTHSLPPNPPSDTSNPYRHPLPWSNILLHAGDLTKLGRRSEHLGMLSMLKNAPAELKLVIAGNHDITLDEEYYTRVGHYRHRFGLERFTTGGTGGTDVEDVDAVEDPVAIKALWTSADAQAAGIRYLEEGTREFRLSTGARVRVYASPYTPEFCEWAFAYERGEDRYDAAKGARNPVPTFPPGVDVMLTHGPPYGILDQVVPGHESVGCEHLYRAAERAKPRLHVFGHIHEGYGARRFEWSTHNRSMIQCDETTAREERCAFVDVSESTNSSLRVGKETLFINASVVTVEYEPVNAPWVVDLELPLDEDGGRSN
ncbi:40S ribosomal protein S8e [Aspergillus steynii IBT 23096]|uniref:40S ribosomal protein S8 n=1 Tax=Aspergillus steynii IBT 23096 TaxID=1392250 RepID=A0A2I2GQW1_9EURO|nr:40S ribosomal protein S8e [Aspergillus steynii IBT 23096]PLB55224.1 40S ribosomal protein S8e [Aspergillus steynii IBT 23096]